MLAPAEGWFRLGKTIKNINMEKKIKIIIVLYCFVVGCGIAQSNVTDKKCSDERKLENLIQKIIETPELQQYYNIQNGLEQDNLVVLKSNETMKVLNIKKFGKAVLFLSKSEILEKKIKAFIEFKKIDISEQMAAIEMVYEIQGIEYIAKYKLNGCEWQLTEKKLYEN